MKDNRKKGDLGEKIACNLLKKNGFKIVCTNYQKRTGEIDIVAKKKETLHFIEVKTRSDSSISSYGLPQDAVGKIKQRKIINTALYYLSEGRFPENTLWQIDVIAITINWETQKAKISFLENAVEDF